LPLGSAARPFPLQKPHEINEIFERPAELVDRLQSPRRGALRISIAYPETRVARFTCSKNLLPRTWNGVVDEARDRARAAEELALGGGVHRLPLLIPGYNECNGLRDKQCREGRADELRRETSGPISYHSEATSTERL
jgi:hypothetical protein